VARVTKRARRVVGSQKKTLENNSVARDISKDVNRRAYCVVADNECIEINIPE
jgi:hypothetical protein